MKQVVFIHGGTTFYEYENYLDFLRSKPASISGLTRQRLWFDRLQEDLGDEFHVLAPAMPNSTNANYDEWAIWFGRIAEMVDDNVILVGHSMGGIFLAKYLSEHDFPKKIRAVLLVAAPYEDEAHEDLASFKITGGLEKFAGQGGDIIFYHGTDDIVPLSELELYEKSVPKAEAHELSAQDHFVREAFPEIIETIKGL
ncbi:MAG TPA: alpha/beta fold hydrolase [Candidatus Saccharimonadales bacterium]